jgi:hypothetical protein
MEQSWSARSNAATVRTIEIDESDILAKATTSAMAIRSLLRDLLGFDAPPPLGIASYH